MIDLYRNNETRNFDIDITTEEWMEILSLPDVKKKLNLLQALEDWYLSPGHTGSCKSMALKHARSANFYSRNNSMLGKIATEYVGRFRPLGYDGNETWWGIAWIELKKEKGIYTVCLRPELIEAIERLGLFGGNTKTKVDTYLSNHDFRMDEVFSFTYEKGEKQSSVKQVVRSFPRNPVAARNALNHAAHQCEINPDHETFPRKTDGVPYMETHHLIPLTYSDRFGYSLDVPENIISLCSKCHDQIHYGKLNKTMVEQLWLIRHTDLEKVGIGISLAELLEMYHA